MTTLSGTVLGSNNAPMVNVPVTLLGENVTKVILTDATGGFAFTDLGDGDYKLIVTHRDLNVASQRTVTIKEGQDAPAIILRLSTEETESISEDNRYVPLKYTQYIFLMLVGLIYFIFIGFGVRDITVKDLRDLESARGIITYLVAVTTIAMAAMLMLAAIMTGGRDLDKRFTLGKEILTTLIGVLGTIIGFYYGSTTKPDTAPAPGAGNPSTITVNGFNPTPSDPKIGKSFSISSTVVGGQPPYNYTLTASPTGTIETISKSTRDGRIDETVTVPTSATSGSATLTLTIKDAKGTSFPTSTTINVKQ